MYPRGNQGSLPSRSEESFLFRLFGDGLKAFGEVTSHASAQQTSLERAQAVIKEHLVGQEEEMAGDTQGLWAVQKHSDLVAGRQIVIGVEGLLHEEGFDAGCLWRRIHDHQIHRERGSITEVLEGPVDLVANAFRPVSRILAQVGEESGFSLGP